MLTDIGGILPGSMPPTSKTLFVRMTIADSEMSINRNDLQEEGAQIKSFKILKKGDYDRDGLLKLLCEEPAQYDTDRLNDACSPADLVCCNRYPGCSGTRCLRDVESDLHAQIAANQKYGTPIR